MGRIQRLASMTASFVLWLGGAEALAQDAPHIWQLTSDTDLQQLRDAGELPGRVNVSIDKSLVSAMAKGFQLKVPVLSQLLEVQIADTKHYGNTQVWQATNLDSPHLPATQFYLNGGELSAWIPTERGTFRLINGQLVKEYKDQNHSHEHRQPHVELTQGKLVEGMRTATLPQRLVSDLSDEAASFVPSSVTSVVSSDSSSSQDETLSEMGFDYRVLFVVTNEFASSFPDTEAQITEYITANNAIYTASGMDIQMVSAGVVVADLEQFSPVQILDNLSSDSAEESTDGDIDDSVLAPIWQARVDNSADFIAVLVNELPDGACGRGWVNGNEDQAFLYDYAVSVTSAFTTFGESQQACGFDTLGHELGHNMGLRHSLQQGEEGTVFSYGRGYGIENEFTTVMAYPQEFGTAEALPLFSSPDLICLDAFACGVDRNQADGADAVYAVNQVKEDIAYIHNDAVSVPAAEILANFDEDFQSCINQSFPNLYSNEQIRTVNCSQLTIDSFEYFANMPRLRFVSVKANDADLSPFEGLDEIEILDLQRSQVSSLREIAHLRDQLSWAQFDVRDLSCQDVNVAQSWGIDTLIPINSEACNALNNDDEDFDNDGMSNLIDTDDDNDGIDDITDHAPFDASNANDIDNDGIEDSLDAFPYDENESVDTDLDTLGNNRDTDDDNDGVLDTDDCAPLDNSLSTNCPVDIPFVAYDYDGDGSADVGVRRASDFFQYILNSSDSVIQRVQFGRDSGDISVSGDFDGDKIADVAVRRPSNQFWYILNSSDGVIQRFNFGLQEADIPVPADYDGDGITDIAVRRPSNQFWYILNSSDNEIQRINFGLQEADIPVPADYDGDGIADVAVRRPSNQVWYVQNSSGIDPVDGNADGISRVNFGLQEGDIPVAADFDGDGRADFAVRRPSAQFWYIKNSSGLDPIDGNADGISRVRFGLQETDIPIVADYDGDGKADIAVRRASNQFQYILRSSDQQIERIQFGRNSADMPLAAPVLTRMDVTVSSELTDVTEEFNGTVPGFERSIMDDVDIKKEQVK